MTYLIFFSTFMAVGLGILSVLLRKNGRRRTHEILQGQDPAQQQATAAQQLTFGERFENAARQADLHWKARSYFISAGAAIGLGSLLSLSGRSFIPLLLSAAVVAIPWLLIRRRHRIRAEEFVQQLPAALLLAANTIRAGGTLLQAVRAITRQMTDPVKSEFARVEQALQLQVPLGVALEQMSRRIGVKEFTAVVVACKVAGEAGADLDRVLESISKEIVEDREFKEAMWAASSEGRTSAKLVSVIPFAMTGFFLWRSPRYFDPMLVTPAGTTLLIGCFLAIGVGWLMIARIVDARNW